MQLLGGQYGERYVPDSDEQRTHDHDDPDLAERREDAIADRRVIEDDLDELAERIDEIRDEMIHPRAARTVLEHTGISEAQAADLVETMQEVDRRTRDDDIV